MSKFDAFKVELDDRELQVAFKRLSRKMGIPILKKAARAGAQVFLVEAKSLVPVKTGELKKSIRMKQKTKHHQVDVRVIAAAPHAHLVEFGTEPHRVGKGLHPGAAPRPFLRPAFDNKKEEALAKAREVLAKSVLSAAKK